MPHSANHLSGTPKGKFRGPLFIVGVPRSGTKLLRDLLNRNPRIGIPDEESQFLPEFVCRFGSHPELGAESQRIKFINELEQTNFCRLMRRKKQSLDRRRLQAAFSKGEMAEIFEAAIRSFLPPDKTTGPDIIWGDKTPFYAMHLPMLAGLYPHARFIHIIRDPRDVAYSGRRAWKKSFVRSAIDWRNSICATSHFRDDPNRKTPFCEVKYEDLLDDPESVLRKVCRFCGIEFGSEMLTLEKSTETWGRGKGATSILQDNVRKFEKIGTERELRAIEELVYDEMIACGYDIFYATGSRRETKIELLWHKLLDGVLVLSVYIREKGLIEGVRYKLKQRHLRRSVH